MPSAFLFPSDYTHFRRPRQCKINSLFFLLNCRSVFGNTLDLHSGGIDLKFPHHNNEIAQCEAHYGGPWVKQFIHSGISYHDNRVVCSSYSAPYTILMQGISRLMDWKCQNLWKILSLSRYHCIYVVLIFIINLLLLKDLLKTHTADEYRMFCLMHHYSSSVTFSEDRMMDARNVIETISNFLHTARHLLDTEQMLRFCRMSEADLHLQQ